MIINSNCIENKYFNPYSLALSLVVNFPIFQREFSWKEEQTNALLNEIKDFAENDYGDKKQIYLLDFIGFEENNKFNLADGQQRLVAMAILIKCLLDYASEHEITVKIKNYNINYENVETQIKWKKFCSGIIVAPFKKIYIYMREYIEQNSMLIHEIEDVLMNHIWVYIKYAQNADDAFDIFEQINTGGKPLSKDEVIKTVIKQYSNKYNLDLNVKERELKKHLISYCKYCGISNSQFNNLAIMSFLNEYVVINKESFLDFKKYIHTIEKIDDLPIVYVAKLLNRNQIMDIICIYEVKGADLKNNRKVIENVLLPLFLLCIIWSLAAKNPGGRIKGFLDNVVSMVRNGKSVNDISTYFLWFADKNKDICNVTLDSFADMLKGKNKENILKALLLMDIVLSNTSGLFNKDLINLEHIYPKKPDTVWSCNGYPVNQEDQEELIHNIGNYLILNDRINRKIQNKYITEKRVEYERIILNDKVLQTVTNTVNFDKFEQNRKSYIDERRREIALYIRDKFPCGRAFIQ